MDTSAFANETLKFTESHKENLVQKGTPNPSLCVWAYTSHGPFCCVRFYPRDFTVTHIS